MPRQVPESFHVERTSETNEPILLFRVNVSDTPEASGEEDLFLTNQTDTVSYFKTDDNVDTAQDYIPSQISIDSLSSNMEGEIDAPRVTISNVSREIISFILSRDMRKRRVVIREVFRETLGDASAHLEEVFYIDSITGDRESVTFNLTSKFDVLHIGVPRRRFTRVCQWTYKKFGCWEDNGDGTFSEPTGFSLENYPILDNEISRKARDLNLRGRFRPAKALGFNASTDKLIFDVKVDDPSLIVAASGVQISSDRGNTIHYQYDDLTGLSIDTEYTTVTLDFSDFTATSGFDPLNINWINFFNTRSSVPLTGPMKMWVRSVKIRIVKPHEFVTGTLDRCDYTFLDCLRHGNQNRFGGFPAVPDRRSFRI